MAGEAAVLTQEEVKQQVVLRSGVLHRLQRHLQLLLLRISRAQPLHARAQVLVQLHTTSTSARGSPHLATC